MGTEIQQKIPPSAEDSGQSELKASVADAAKKVKDLQLQYNQQNESVTNELKSLEIWKTVRQENDFKAYFLLGGSNLRELIKDAPPRSPGGYLRNIIAEESKDLEIDIQKEAKSPEKKDLLLKNIYAEYGFPEVYEKRTALAAQGVTDTGANPEYRAFVSELLGKFKRPNFFNELEGRLKDALSEKPAGPALPPTAISQAAEIPSAVNPPSAAAPAGSAPGKVASTQSNLPAAAENPAEATPKTGTAANGSGVVHTEVVHTGVVQTAPAQAAAPISAIVPPAAATPPASAPQPGGESSTAGAAGSGPAAASRSEKLPLPIVPVPAGPAAPASAPVQTVAGASAAPEVPASNTAPTISVPAAKPATPVSRTLEQSGLVTEGNIGEGRATSADSTIAEAQLEPARVALRAAIAQSREDEAKNPPIQIGDKKVLKQVLAAAYGEQAFHRAEEYNGKFLGFGRTKLFNSLSAEEGAKLLEIAASLKSGRVDSETVIKAGMPEVAERFLPAELSSKELKKFIENRYGKSDASELNFLSRRYLSLPAKEQNKMLGNLDERRREAVLSISDLRTNNRIKPADRQYLS